MNITFYSAMEISRKTKKYVLLNLIPRNIRIVSNILAGPKNVISDNYVARKYHFGKAFDPKMSDRPPPPPYVCVPSATLGSKIRLLL